MWLIRMCFVYVHFVFFSDKLKIICMNQCMMCTQGYCVHFVYMKGKKGILNTTTTGTKLFEVSARVCTLSVCISNYLAFHYIEV